MDRYSSSERGTFSRFVRYLKTRNAECWGFFAAGFVIAAILN